MGKATARGFGKDRISGYLFIAPAVALFAVFQIYPLFRTAVLSFREFVGSAFVNVGFRNYGELFSDTIFARSLLNSALFVVINIPAILAFTLFVSYRIYRSHRVLLGFYRIAFYLPSVASIVTISVVWKNLLNPVMGLANYVLGLAGRAPVVWLGQGYAFGSLTVILFTINVGMSLILYISAMQNIPAALVEAARIDGAGQRKVFFSIVLPLVVPTTLFVVVINTINLFQSFALVNLLTKGGPYYATSTIVFQIYDTAFSLQRYGLASAMGIVLGVVIAVVSLVQYKIVNRDVEY
jgi:multiple sugar transport system permease protein